ncbi:unnamed protein product [Gadus morhua 'NCC']
MIGENKTPEERETGGNHSTQSGGHVAMGMLRGGVMETGCWRPTDRGGEEGGVSHSGGHWRRCNSNCLHSSTPWERPANPASPGPNPASPGPCPASPGPNPASPGPNTKGPSPLIGAPTPHRGPHPNSGALCLLRGPQPPQGPPKLPGAPNPSQGPSPPSGAATPLRGTHPTSGALDRFRGPHPTPGPSTLSRPLMRASPQRLKLEPAQPPQPQHGASSPAAALLMSTPWTSSSRAGSVRSAVVCSAAPSPAGFWEFSAPSSAMAGLV